MKLPKNITHALPAIAIVLCTTLSVWSQDFKTLQNQFLEYYETEQFDKAIVYGEELLHMTPEVGNDSTRYYLLQCLSDCYFFIEDFDKGIDLYSQALRINNLTTVETNQLLANHLLLFAYDFLFEGNFDISVEMSTRAYDLYNKNPENWHESAKALNLIGNCFLFQDRNKEAIEQYRRELEIYDKKLGKNNVESAAAITQIGDCFSYDGNYTEAIESFHKAFDIYKNIGGENIIDAARMLAKIADSYFLIDQPTNAIEYYSNAIGIYNDAGQNQSSEYAQLLKDAAFCYFSIADYSNAIDLYSQSDDIFIKVGEDNSRQYAQLLHDYAACHYAIGDYANSLSMHEKSLEIFKKQPDENQGIITNALINIGQCYASLGNHEVADYYFSQAMDEFNVNGYNYQDLGFLASCYSTMGKYEKAIELYLIKLEADKNGEGRSSSITASLIGLARCYSMLNDYEKAIYYYSQANEIIAATLGKDNPMCAMLLNSIGICHNWNGNYNEAIEYFTRALETYQQNSNEGLSDYEMQYLMNIALTYIDINDFTHAYYYLQKGVDLDRQFLIRNLGGLTETRRDKYWNSTSLLYNSVFPAVALVVDGQNAASELYDTSALFAKGLLLSTELELQRIINESKDSSLIEKSKNLQLIKREIKKTNEQHLYERNTVLFELENKARKLEEELIEESKKYGVFTKNLDFTWQNIQEKLDATDVAVEFLSFPMFDNDSIMYIALTVRPGYEQPRLTVLCEEKELDADRAYTNTAVSELIWKPLATELMGVRNIYFSPSGLLHTIAIESMPHWEKTDSLMSDIYNIYRLSSTRELAMKRNTVEASGTVLYGGIEYVCDVQSNRKSRQKLHENKTVNKKSSKKKSRSADFGLRDDTFLEKLTWSGYEVDDIQKMLGKDVKTIKDCAATETSFKNLSGKKIKNIHIATHGFYWNDSTAREKKVRFTQLDNNINEEDKAMTRTGLFFSGAQRIFDPEAEFTDTIDDGVLTAKEVADLDLRGLDLVALSACQTGLGDIVGSEGVFGLQRGFKKAGAQSIIMSLWPVHDEATKDFMVKFYDSLNSHKTKREAFIKAQNFIMDKDHKGLYDYYGEGLSPARPHWAAFILLDALQ